MQVEVVDSGRKLPTQPTISQRMATVFITVYAIRQNHLLIRDYDILRGLVMMSENGDKRKPK